MRNFLQHNHGSMTLNPSERSQSEDDLYMSPAEYVIFMFRGVSETARAVGRTRSCVCKWQNPKHVGHVGEVPGGLMKKILEIAEARGLDITPRDLIYGRRVKVKYE